MSVNYFGNRSSSNSESPFYKLKNVLLLNKTNTARGQDAGMPVYRTAVANNLFKAPSAAEISLGTITSAGGVTAVATVSTTTHLANSVAACYHLNTSDQCLYVLAYTSSPSIALQLMKVSDSTGVLTAIGSSFVPANPTWWPSSATSNNEVATMYVDGSNHIRVYMDGYYHQINKTTGAIVSQDTIVTIGSYNLKDTSYLNTTGTVACQRPVAGGVAGDQTLGFPSIHSVASGIVVDLNTKVSNIFDQRQSYAGSDFSQMIRVDSDKVFFGNLGIGGSTRSFGYYNISDFDQCLQSIVDWYSGA
jgi:hypothetical protein